MCGCSARWKLPKQHMTIWILIPLIIPSSLFAASSCLQFIYRFNFYCISTCIETKSCYDRDDNKKRVIIILFLIADGRLDMITGSIIFFQILIWLLLIDVNRIFLVDLVSVIRSKIVSKKNEREKEFVNAGTARILAPRRKTRFFVDASVLHWPPPVLLSSTDDNRGQKSDDSMNTGRCNWWNFDAVH